MQPYLFPYQGYFNLISAVDILILRDSVQYSKGGWINRNKLEVNGLEKFFTVPLHKGSDFEAIFSKTIHTEWQPTDLKKLFVPWLAGASSRETVLTLPSLNSRLDKSPEQRNLVRFLRNTLLDVTRLLGLQTQISLESEASPAPVPSSEEGVVELCRKLGAREYLNLPGGKDLYHADTFRRVGIELKFIEPHLREYSRAGRRWLPGLSVLDSIAFAGVEETKKRVVNDFTTTNPSS